MPAYSVFTALPSGLPEGAVSWNVELGLNMQLKGTLSIRGDSSISIGDLLTIGGLEYRVTNRSYDKTGMSETTTLILRDRAYELYFVCSPVHISWVTAPEYILRQERLQNLQEPFKTDLRTKEGDIFGANGWQMREICADIAAIGGWNLNYALPDFFVRQLSLDRRTPLMQFLQSTLSVFLPRIYVEGGTLHIVPGVADGVSSSMSVVETLSHSLTRQESYYKLRVSGGIGPFDQWKWEGAPINWNVGDQTLKYYMNKIEGLVETQNQEGTRKYYSVISDTHTVTITASVYSKDLFKNDQVLLFKEEWKFNRKYPLLIQTKAELEAALAGMQEYSVEDPTTTPPTWPSSSEFYLESCDRTVNVYEGIAKEWEQPLLVQTSHSQWKYLWWSSWEVSEDAGNLPPGADAGYQNPPLPSVMPSDDSPLGSPFAAGYTTTLTPLGAGVGFIDSVTGVWNTEAYCETTVYKYQYQGAEAIQFSVLGGLLLERNYLAFATVSPKYPNLSMIKSPGAGIVVGVVYGDIVTKDRPQRYVAAIENSVDRLDAAIAFPASNSIARVAQQIESYRQASLMTVEKSVATMKMIAREENFMDVNTPDTNHWAEIQFETSSSTEYIPYTEAPQTLVKGRGMQVYSEVFGADPAGRRWVEIDFPLIIDWWDMWAVAPRIRQIHPEANTIVSTVVTSPEAINLSLALLGGSVVVSGLPAGIDMGSNARLVAGTLSFGGDGSVSTQLAIQGEMPV